MISWKTGKDDKSSAKTTTTLRHRRGEPTRIKYRLGMPMSTTNEEYDSDNLEWRLQLRQLRMGITTQTVTNEDYDAGKYGWQLRIRLFRVTVTERGIWKTILKSDYERQFRKAITKDEYQLLSRVLKLLPTAKLTTKNHNRPIQSKSYNAFRIRLAKGLLYQEYTWVWMSSDFSVRVWHCLQEYIHHRCKSLQTLKKF